MEGSRQRFAGHQKIKTSVKFASDEQECSLFNFPHQQLMAKQSKSCVWGGRRLAVTRWASRNNKTCSLALRIKRRPMTYEALQCLNIFYGYSRWGLIWWWVIKKVDLVASYKKGFRRGSGTSCSLLASTAAPLNHLHCVLWSFYAPY